MVYVHLFATSGRTQCHHSRRFSTRRRSHSDAARARLATFATSPVTVSGAVTVGWLDSSDRSTVEGAVQQGARTSPSSSLKTFRGLSACKWCTQTLFTLSATPARHLCHRLRSALTPRCSNPSHPIPAVQRHQGRRGAAEVEPLTSRAPPAQLRLHDTVSRSSSGDLV